MASPPFHRPAPPVRRNDRTRRLAALLARLRAGEDPRPRELAALRHALRELEHALPGAMARRELDEAVYDALTAQVAERERRLREEWRRLAGRDDLHHLDATDDVVTIELDGDAGRDCQLVRLRAGAPVDMLDARGRPIQPPPDLRRLLVRLLAAGRVNNLLDRLIGRAPGQPATMSAPRFGARTHEDAFARVLLTPWLRRLEQARAAVADAQAATDMHERAWRDAARREAALAAELALSGPEEALPGEDDLAVLDRLLALPGVEDVEVEGDTVVVRTAPIEILADGARHALGRYTLRLHLPSWKVEIRAERPGNPHGVDHPHVSRGIPCFGTDAEQARAYWRRGDLVGLVRFLLAFLHSYDPGGAYLAIGAWPRASADSPGGA